MLPSIYYEPHRQIMNKLNQVFFLTILCFFATEGKTTEVAICTDAGNFIVELYDEEAPLHVENFIYYVEKGFYLGTVFHRVIKDFVVQGGGYTRNFRGKPISDPIKNESKNGIKNNIGTLAAARASNPNSATSQFYINLSDNPSLDATRNNFGYTVFGEVKIGMDTIKSIADLPTSASGPFISDVTQPLIAITAITVVPENRYPEMALEQKTETLLKEIYYAINEEAFESAESFFREYHAICGEVGPELMLLEIKVLAALEKNQLATEILAEYLRIADNTKEEYLEALALSRQLTSGMVIPESRETIRLREISGDCSFPVMPDLPDARIATINEMVEAQNEVKKYIELSNIRLECLDKIINTSEDPLVYDDLRLVTAAYNQAVDMQNDIAGSFNTQRTIFLERQ